MRNTATTILAILTTALAFGQDKKQYQYNNYIPTKNGIQNYIDLNEAKIVNTVENFIGDTIFSYGIKTENLSEYLDSDTLEAGRFYPPDEIVITNEQNFYDYELSFVPKWKQRNFDSNTKFVKGVLIHELVHLYIYQFINECLGKNIPISSEYIYFSMFPSGRYYASEFIEEGICEYVVMKLKEGIFSDNKPDCQEQSEINIRKFIKIQYNYDIKYQYSRSYVQKIFETNSFKKALLVIFTSKPPSYEELICPDLYYDRLTKHSKELL